MRYLVFGALLLTGCSVLAAKMLSPQDVAESIQILEAAKASGCAYLRARANPPAAQVELDMVYAFGGNGYLDCVKELRPR